MDFRIKSDNFVLRNRKGARVAEEARLESVWPPKGAREFESRSLRKFLTALQIVPQSRFCIMFMSSHFDRLSD